MQLWTIFVAMALVFGLLGWYRTRRTGSQSPRSPRNNSPMPISTNVQPTLINDRVPTVWDERYISEQLATIQDKPQILTAYLAALKQRFIISVEDGTAQTRTRFLRTIIEQLELGKQYKTLTHDLKALESEQENRLLRLELERREIKTKLEQTEALDGLQLQKERLTKELEVAELRAKKKAIQNPPADSKLTADQQRRLKRLEIEDKLRELDRLEDGAVSSARTAEDRVRVQNMHTEKREELREQLTRYLV
jgi:hypothetical protein